MEVLNWQGAVKAQLKCQESSSEKRRAVYEIYSKRTPDTARRDSSNMNCVKGHINL
jgi:hypothetical protein